MSSINFYVDVSALKLARVLDGLPLTLVTARVYLKKVTIGFLDYLRLYNKS
jgi:hypothetical protein